MFTECPHCDEYVKWPNCAENDFVELTDKPTQSLPANNAISADCLCKISIAAGVACCVGSS